MARAGIKAVLTGGACASLYSRGEYQSSDLDFILQSAVSRRSLDAVMRTIGFQREGGHYRHPTAQFFVEFPAGPLGIGSDLKIQPVAYRVGRVKVLALSPTDSCRDRLAAFYHWRDRQSLSTAVAVARQRKVDVGAIRTWSEKEGASEEFAEFLSLLERSRPARRSRTRRPQATVGKRTR